LDGVLESLSQHFVLAEKPLAFVAERYLSLRKQRLFGGGSLTSMQ
jgi:hypothetical protein